MGAKDCSGCSVDRRQRGRVEATEQLGGYFSSQETGVGWTRVQVEKVSATVRFWIYSEDRADRRAQGHLWLEPLGEWCYHL